MSDHLQPGARFQVASRSPGKSDLHAAQEICSALIGQREPHGRSTAFRGSDERHVPCV